jgi:hypothetical protein
MDNVILQAINGVSLAALLFLLASGFTLSFGLMRVVNMAHGAYYLLGGYVGLSVAQKTGSFALAIVGAEYVLGLLPRGTHEYAKLIRPAELAAWCRKTGLEVTELTGLHHNPATGSYWLDGNVDVNYFARAERPKR